MENIAPPMKLSLYLKFGIERGEALRGVVRTYLKEVDDELSTSVTHVMLCLEQGLPVKNLLSREKSPYRRALLHLICQGFEGKPILQSLQSLEGEIQRACDIEIERTLATLPLKLLLPLLFLQFPAFLLLLLGPLLRQIVAGF